MKRSRLMLCALIVCTLAGICLLETGCASQDAKTNLNAATASQQAAQTQTTADKAAVDKATTDAAIAQAKAASDKAAADKALADLATATTDADRAAKQAALDKAQAAALASLAALKDATDKQDAATITLTGSTKRLSESNANTKTAIDAYNASVDESAVNIKTGLHTVGTVAGTAIPGYGSIITMICEGLAALVGVGAAYSYKKTADNSDAIVVKKDAAISNLLDTSATLSNHVQAIHAATPTVPPPPAVQAAMTLVAANQAADHQETLAGIAA